MADAGPNGEKDPDGSISDIGAFGGPNANADFGSSYQDDTDSDGLVDGWELHYGTQPLVNDAQTDDDGDGLTLTDEYDFGSSPILADTDFDGVDDGDE